MLQIPSPHGAWACRGKLSSIMLTIALACMASTAHARSGTIPLGFAYVPPVAGLRQRATGHGRIIGGSMVRATRSGFKVRNVGGRSLGCLKMGYGDELEDLDVAEARTAGRLQKFEMSSFKLESGEKMKNVTIVYEVHGTINESGDNVILHPTSFGATHRDLRYRIGRGKQYTLDTTDNAVVVVNLLGNGVSTSPSMDKTLSKWKYPTVHDNVVMIDKLLTEELGIKVPLKMMFGYSMGAMCALQYGCIFPDKVDRIAAICGVAKTTNYNRLFIKSLRAALTTDRHWNAGEETFEGEPREGMRAFGTIYAGWGLSPDFYRTNEFLQGGFRSVDDFVEDYIEGFEGADAHDLLAQLMQWDIADISNNQIFKGDLGAALSAIRAETWYLPCKTDRYFTPKDVTCELGKLHDGVTNFEVHEINSTWGHRAGDPHRDGQEEQAAYIRGKIHSLLAKHVDHPANDV